MAYRPVRITLLSLAVALSGCTTDGGSEFDDELTNSGDGEGDNGGPGGLTPGGGDGGASNAGGCDPNVTVQGWG